MRNRTSNCVNKTFSFLLQFSFCKPFKANKPVHPTSLELSLLEKREPHLVGQESYSVPVSGIEQVKVEEAEEIKIDQLSECLLAEICSFLNTKDIQSFALSKKNIHQFFSTNSFLYTYTAKRFGIFAKENTAEMNCQRYHLANRALEYFFEAWTKSAASLKKGEKILDTQLLILFANAFKILDKFAKLNYRWPALFLVVLHYYGLGTEKNSEISERYLKSLKEDWKNKTGLDVNRQEYISLFSLVLLDHFFTTHHQTDRQFYEKYLNVLAVPRAYS